MKLFAGRKQRKQLEDKVLELTQDLSKEKEKKDRLRNMLFQRSKRLAVSETKKLNEGIAKTFEQPKVYAKDGAAMDSTPACTPMDDRGSYGLINDQQLGYFYNHGFMGYTACATIGQHWFASKACTIKGKVAVGAGYKLSINGETDENAEAKIKEIRKWERRHKVKRNLVQAEKFKEVFGVRHILFRVDGHDPELPLNFDSVKKGQYRGFSQPDPQWVYPILEGESLTQPASIDFYTPDYFLIAGQRYHKSWVVMIIGDEVADVMKPFYRYGGISLTQKLWQRVYSAERCADEAPELLATMRMIVEKTDVAAAILDEESFIEGQEFNARMRTNFSTRIINREDDVTQIQTTLAGVSELTMDQYQIASAIAEAPITIMMSDTPKGFAATGENELKQFYETCSWVQDELSEILDKHYELLERSLFGTAVGIEHEWCELGQMTEKEAAEIREIDSRTALNYVTGMVVSGEEIRDKLSNDPESGYNLATRIEGDAEERALDELIKGVEDEL